MAGGNCSCCCCCCIDTYKYTQCRHKHAHTPRRVAMLQGSCKKCSILMRTTSGAVCIGVRVRGCACATPGVIVTAAVTLTATFYYYCCFIAAATVFFSSCQQAAMHHEYFKIQNYSQCERRTACTTLLNGLDVRYRTWLNKIDLIHKKHCLKLI